MNSNTGAGHRTDNRTDIFVFGPNCVTYTRNDGEYHTASSRTLRNRRLRRLQYQGEISLRGKVLPVGGIKEKLIGALRAGVRTVLLPSSNRKDVKDLPQEVKDGLDIVHVRYVSPMHDVPLILSVLVSRV